MAKKEGALLDFNQISSLMNELQSKTKEIEEETQKRSFTAKSGGGLVSVSANGKGEIIDITIDDSLLDDKESLQILLISAINDVLANVQNNRNNMAMELLGDLNLNLKDL
ncbi:MAG: YbaB/EbfC family nucleoid-associated protein [Helicobacter sp.]|nr:YbaB/EbfC family nucleoid-associated protein [Helicobacter sp.]